MTTSMRSVRGLFIHSARRRPSSSSICLSILSSVWPHIQLERSSPRCGCWTPAIGKKGATAAIVATWRRRVEKEEGGPRATELAFQSSMAGELVTSEVIETSPPSIYLYIFVGSPPPFERVLRKLERWGERERDNRSIGFSLVSN